MSDLYHSLCIKPTYLWFILLLMCIAFWTVSHPGYKLILASNRDEYLDRPASAAHWHAFEAISNDHLGTSSVPPSSGSDARPLSQYGDESWVISGRDLGSPEAGTWLGMTRDLRLGILLSVRQGFKRKPLNPPSRGRLVKDFLSSKDNSTSVHDHLAALRGQIEDYDGFNLLLMRLHPPSPSAPALSPRHANDAELASAKRWGKPEIGYLSNHPSHTLVDIMSPTRVPTPVRLDTDGPGKPLQRKGTKVGMCAGLSNSSLSQPWPKVSKGEIRMTETLKDWTEKGEGEEDLTRRMQELLSQSIPLTSLGDVKNCTCLHPVKLGADPDAPLGDNQTGRWYGTRVSTVILVKDTGEVTFVERDVFLLNAKGEPVEGDKERTFRWNTMPHAA